MKQDQGVLGDTVSFSVARKVVVRGWQIITYQNALRLECFPPRENKYKDAKDTEEYQGASEAEEEWARAGGGGSASFLIVI